MSKKFKSRNRAYYRVLAWHGANLLDNVSPGWYKSIDQSLLDMSRSDACILGQSYSWYEKGKDELGLTDNEVQMYGFFIKDPDPRQNEYDNDSAINEDYSKLTEAWLDEIKKRINNDLTF